MWGKFLNPNGDINDINNYIQGTAGSLPEWGNTWRNPDIWTEEGWRNDLPADWIPPTPIQITTPPVDQGTADLWQAMLDLSAQFDALKGGN